jgi:hypothetical protein
LVLVSSWKFDKGLRYLIRWVDLEIAEKGVQAVLINRMAVFLPRWASTVHHQWAASNLAPWPAQYRGPKVRVNFFGRRLAVVKKSGTS